MFAGIPQSPVLLNPGDSVCLLKIAVTAAYPCRILKQAEENLVAYRPVLNPSRVNWVGSTGSHFVRVIRVRLTLKFYPGLTWIGSRAT